MGKATEKRIYLTRHGEAEHNVTRDYTIQDAPLTPLGREQSAALYKETKDTIQKTAELLASSPMRRAMSTALIGYADLKTRLEDEGRPMVILPELQECSSNNCDTGLPREDLESEPEYAGLDFSRLTPDWTSKQGFFSPEHESLAARARWNRKWLRERPEKDIVVVGHGACLRYILDGTDSKAAWGNTEVRVFTFKCEEDEDEEGEAWLIPVPVPGP